MGLFRRKKRGMKKVEAQIEAIQSELNSLQRDARSLAGSIGKAAGDAFDTAEAVYNGAGKWTADNVKTVRGSVRNQPLTAVLVSLGAGAVLGALFLRR
ncbi:MAG TPA: hypothetical protein VHT03_14870 [Rhizomicrobium sp.]|jgi:ElaB/YqjD/DUF883 family membrane-anchored ribosome-binding protein|nr:hypothetical protein [Rhizomicrobium sp.]